MVQKIVNTLLKRRHFWRTVGFDELSELYASMLIRSLALSLIGIFVPIYLYKIGYSVQAILGYYTVFFMARVVVDILVAFVVARVGPKHTIAYSTLGNIVYLSMLLSIAELGWPLPLLALVGTVTNSLFFVAFHTDFSKIKHSNNGGKEVGFMIIIERLGGVLGPLVGGLLATLGDPKYTMVLAIVLFAASLLPLLATSEPVKTHQTITFKGLQYKKYKRHFISYACHNTENTASVLLWVFFMAVAVFTTNTYAKIGLITAISTASSMFLALIIGKRIDNKQGTVLLRTGVVLNSITHILRAFAVTPFRAIAVNMSNDPVTIMYRMPFVKNFYDLADSATGYRIAFIALSESTSAFARSIFWLVLFISSFHFSDLGVMKAGFIIAAVVGLGIALQPTAYDNHK